MVLCPFKDKENALYIIDDIPDEFITRADNALYESKHKGKNQFNVELLNGV